MWAPKLCMLVPGLCTSVFYVKWAHLAAVTQDAIFCGFICVFFVFLSYFRLVSLQYKNHQNSWNSLVITPTTTVDVHSSCLYAGVDDINFAVKDRQHRPASSTHVTSSPTLARSPAALEAVDRGRGALAAVLRPASLPHATRPVPCARL